MIWFLQKQKLLLARDSDIARKDDAIKKILSFHRLPFILSGFVGRLLQVLQSLCYIDMPALFLVFTVPAASVQPKTRQSAAQP